jgi:F-type H+-transporting ATPase subunit gamma
MATLREVRRRIAGVKATQKITKAMKMVAAAKLRRAQSAVVAVRPYARMMGELLQHLLPGAEGEAAEYVHPRDVQAVALLLVTSDRGLCGGFNTNLLRSAMEHVDAKYPGWFEQGRIKLYCAGRKGLDFFKRRHIPVARKFVGIYDTLEFADAKEIVGTLVEGYFGGEFDRVELIYNEFQSVARQETVVEQFLPVLREAGENNTDTGKSEAPPEYIYEPSRGEILGSLIPRYLNFQIWRILLESNAAEQGARMTAMENATENANELIDYLQLQYNKARQAGITKELLEVVSGAEALAQS